MENSRLFLIAISFVWFLLGFGYVAYCLAREIDFFFGWILFVGGPCSLAWYISYRCLKKSQVSVEGVPTRPKELPSTEQKGPIYKTESQEDIAKARAQPKTDVKPIEKPIAAFVLEKKIRYYRERRNRSAILSALGVFWVLVLTYIPLDWPLEAVYTYVVAFLGAIYFFLAFLYSELKVIGLKRTRKHARIDGIS